ncbi:putative transcriptional regulator [Brevibacillus brevis NBRC 100599]|uniref:Putative transcriptional regulator n=1 Tax=Brevibacillus brevis (strain 47 / JCM 6285 / NBRC 100599) TaxID=358681 RepID=C0ZE29_BREBN|nr:ArsR family transcriptional regulator [Brevibacillus brevis]BAH44038.1 putative transcriptional regulator [Brevibacillus brevis NBRC 100599]
MNRYAVYFQEQEKRREILVLLKKRRSINVQELSKHLGITKVAVRKHLDVLHRERYIALRIVRQRTGRPAYVYHLTNTAEHLFPRHYSDLATEMVTGIQDLYGEAFVDQLFEKRMVRMLQNYREVMRGQGFDQRVKMLASIQNEEGYMPHLEKIRDGLYLLEEANCPLLQVAIRFRQACQCELSLFESLIDAHVERTSCMTEGQVKCRYLIREKLSNVESE